MHYAGDCKHPDARNLGEPNITQCWFMPNIGNAWEQPGSMPPSDHDSRLVDMVVLELMTNIIKKKMTMTMMKRKAY